MPSPTFAPSTPLRARRILPPRSVGAALNAHTSNFSSPFAPINKAIGVVTPRHPMMNPEKRTRSCSPYHSPSNPFSLPFRPLNDYSISSDSAASGLGSSYTHMRLHQAIQSASSNLSMGMSRSSISNTLLHPRYASMVGDTRKALANLVHTKGLGSIGEFLLRVCFWVAVVVYISALAGMGADNNNLYHPANGNSTEKVSESRIWTRPVPLVRDDAGLGWKGLDMRDTGKLRFNIPIFGDNSIHREHTWKSSAVRSKKVRSDKQKSLEGIWEAERQSRL